MQINEQLSIPAYLLSREPRTKSAKAVMAIHGHGEAEPCIGMYEDYHHRFALRLAQAGHLVLCPELRGFVLWATWLLATSGTAWTTGNHRGVGSSRSSPMRFSMARP